MCETGYLLECEERTLGRLSVDGELNGVSRRGQRNESLGPLHGLGIRGVDLDDDHTSSDLRGDGILNVDVEGGSLRSLGGRDSEGLEQGLSSLSAGADSQVLAHGDEIRV